VKDLRPLRIVVLRGDNLVPITYTQPGQRAQIRRITGKGEVKRHLSDLGFSIGEYVTVVAENNGNVILNVKNTRIALDKSMANRIMV